jgi:hypothetical protein
MGRALFIGGVFHQFPNCRPASRWPVSSTRKPVLTPVNLLTRGFLIVNLNQKPCRKVGSRSKATGPHTKGVGPREAVIG